MDIRARWYEVEDLWDQISPPLIADLLQDPSNDPSFVTYLKT